MNLLRSARLLPIAAAINIATVAIFPTSAMAVGTTGQVTLTHTQLVAALTNVRSATAAAEQPGWRQVEDLAPGSDFASWTTVTQYDGATGRLAEESTQRDIGQAALPIYTFRSSRITLPNIGVFIGSRTGAGTGNFKAADQNLLDLLGRPAARYALWPDAWAAELAEGKHRALSQLVNNLLQINATATVAHNPNGTFTYIVNARYRDEDSGFRLPATAVLQVTGSNVVTDVVVRTQKTRQVAVAVTRHLTETFSAQTIVRPRAAETVLESDVALAAEARFLHERIRVTANSIAAAVNQDAAAAHRNASPTYIRTIARLRVRGDGLTTPVSVLAVSGGAQLSAVTPFTQKKVVFVIRSVRGLAVVS